LQFERFDEVIHLDKEIVGNRPEAREASRQSLRKYNANITKEKKDGLLEWRRLKYAALTWEDLMAARQKCNLGIMLLRGLLKTRKNRIKFKKTST
jgi:5-methylcytosine-specific restriction endonuclease McrA